MKRLLALILAVSFAVTCFSAVSVSAKTFADMPESHWAYNAVSRLVEEGTVNGMPDGTFNPTGVVSRAEFVKMLGKSSVREEVDFPDVPKDHWAYEDIMYSGLEGDKKGNFNPSAPITRAEVANLLYKRFANGATAKAPYYISSQGTNARATAWVYNTGLIVGADMLNLRLDDNLSRAEAAILIIRTKELDITKTKDFIDNFSDETYQAIYEGLDIFDTPYSPSETMTYEELSIASIRYQYKQRNPAFVYKFEKKYDGEYAHFFNIMCTNPLDQKEYGSTKEEALKNVTVEDAIAMITFGAKRNDYIPSGMVQANGRTYSEVAEEAGTQFSENMSYAYNFGISLYANGKIDAKRAITKKEIACIYMQYGLTFGDHILLRCGYNSEYIPTHIRRTTSSYPANADMYRYILEEIPSYVYDAPYKLKNKILYTPKQFESMAFLHANMFYTPLMYLCSGVYEKGGDIYIEYHPSLLLSVDGFGEIYRVRIDVTTAFDGMKLSDICKLDAGVEDIALKSGDTIWCDMSTNQVRVSTYIDYELFTINQIVK